MASRTGGKDYPVSNGIRFPLERNMHFWIQCRKSRLSINSILHIFSDILIPKIAISSSQTRIIWCENLVLPVPNTLLCWRKSWFYRCSRPNKNEYRVLLFCATERISSSNCNMFSVIIWPPSFVITLYYTLLPNLADVFAILTFCSSKSFCSSSYFWFLL